MNTVDMFREMARAGITAVDMTVEAHLNLLNRMSPLDFTMHYVRRMDGTGFGWHGGYIHGVEIRSGLSYSLQLDVHRHIRPLVRAEER